MSREVDRRRRRTGMVTPARQDRLAALAAEVSERLAGSHRLAVATVDATTGNPAAVTSEAAPAGRGDYVQRALEHLRAAGPALGLAPTQPAEYVVDPAEQRTSADAVTVHAQQRSKGIPIFQAAQAVLFDPRGRLSQTVGTTVTVTRDLEVAPRLGVEAAVLAAAEHVAEPDRDERGQTDQFGEPLEPPGVRLDGFMVEVTATFPDRPERPTVLAPGPFAEAIRASLTWFPLDTDDLRLGWLVTLTLPGHAAQYRVVVDADDGEVLYCRQQLRTVAALAGLPDTFPDPGLGVEAVDARARVHPGPVQGTANLLTPADGSSPVMNLGLVRRTGRHTALDSGVVYHELMHGVTNRLVGGALNVDALDEPQSAGMGEGWSDFVACVINHTDVVGAWVVDDPGGIRAFPYTAEFPDTFADLGRGRYTGVHAIGELWCATLMEMTRRVGQPLAVQLVVDALKLSRANPSFLDMRDAILAALDGKLTAGQLDRDAHHAARRDIWAVFARFGMGPAADCVGATLLGVQADFEPPDQPDDPEPAAEPQPAAGPGTAPLRLEVDELVCQPLPDPDGNGGAAERVRAEVAFRVVGPDAAEVAAARTPWSARVLAELPGTGRTTVLAAVQGRLAPGRPEGRAAAELATPPPGRYRLLGVVSLADRRLEASAAGPRLTVLP